MDLKLHNSLDLKRELLMEYNDIEVANVHNIHLNGYAEMVKKKHHFK